MTESFNANSAPEKPKNDAPHYTWSEIWLAVMTRPSTETFMQILRDPNQSRSRSLMWIASALAASLVISTFASAIVLGVPIFSLIGALMFTLPIAVGFGIGFFMFNAWILNWLAKRFFAGVGEFDEMLYATAAFTAPLLILNGVLGIFGASFAAAITGLLLIIFQFALTGMALRAVHNLNWQQTMGVLAIIIAFSFVLAMLFIGALF